MILYSVFFVFLLCWKLNHVQPDSAFEVEVELDLSMDAGDEIGLKTSIYQEFDSDFYGDEGSFEGIDGQEELVFQPDNLVFMDCPVAIAETSSFQIFNHFGYDIHVTSIVSESNLIHPVMFQPQVIAPNESISLQILFLPYFQENVVSQLIISTSQGDYEYQVKGFPVRNPYGVHPLVGIRIPAHAKFEQPIVVHNPHSDPLHIKEVYTTEGFLTLKGVPLRTNHVSSSGNSVEDEGNAPIAPEIMWVIHPNHEREIITLSVPATLSPGFYQGYVHIKTDHDNMVVPVEMEVLEGAVYSVQQTLEFGTLTSVNEKRSIDLKLFNTGHEPILISEIIPVTADPQLVVNLIDSVVLEPHTSHDVTVATLTYTASSPGKILNKLLIVTNNSNAAVAVVEVMYSVTVLHGGVGFEHQKAIFVAPIRNSSDTLNASVSVHGALNVSTNGSVVLIPRDFVFTNYFNALVSLQNVVVASCNDIFSSEGVLEEVVVDSFGKWPSVVVNFNETAVVELSTQYNDYLPKTCWLEVFTNISSHRIPIYIIDGALELVFMDADMLQPQRSDAAAAAADSMPNADEYHIELGSISIEQPRLLRIALANENPVRIPLELLNATDGVCICTESSWPIGNNDEDAALLHLASFSQRNPVEDSRCSCCNVQGSQNSGLDSTIALGEELLDVKPTRAIGMAKSGYNTMFSISFHNLMDHFGTFETSERNEVTVILGSQYQQIILHLHFTMIKGKFVTLVVPGSQNFPKYTIGKHDTFKVVTILDFEEQAREVALTSTSSVFGHKVEQNVEPGGLDKVKSFTTALFPANLCTHSRLANSSTYGSSLWSCTHEAIKSSASEQKFSKMMKVLRKLEDAALSPPTLDPALFHKDAMRLKRMWSRTSPRGVPLTPSEFVVHSAQALHRFPVQNASIQSPFPYMADSYKVKLPASRTNEVVWFYLSVSNPFAFPLEYSVNIPAFNGSADNVTNPLDHFIDVIPSRGIYDCPTVTKMLEADEEHQKLAKGSLKNEANSAVDGDDVCSVAFPTSMKINLFGDVFVHARRPTASSGAGLMGSSRMIINPEAANSNERFYLHKSAPRMWTVPSNTNSHIIGPIFVNRHVRVADPSVLNTLYVFNNFTGLEKVDVWTGVGNAKLVVSGLMTVLNTTLNEPESLLNRTMMSVSTENSEWMFDGVEVDRLNQVFYVHIVNEGQVNATVLNVDIDGVSCTSSSSGGGFFGGSTRSSLCSSIPVELAPGSEFTVSVRAPRTCFDPTTIQRKVILTMDKEISCIDAAASECHATTKTNELIATMYFHSSPGLEKLCLHKFPGRFFRSLLMFILVLVTTVGGGFLGFHVMRRYIKWMRFCQAKRASNFQHSEILLHSSFAVTAPMLQLIHSLGFQFMLDAFVYGGSEFNKPSSQKRKAADQSSGADSDGFGSESTVPVPATNVAAEGGTDRRNTRNIDLRDILIPDVGGDELQIATSISYVDKVLKSRNIRPKEKKASPSHQGMRLQVPSHKTSPGLTRGLPITPPPATPPSSRPQPSASTLASLATTPVRLAGPSISVLASPVPRTPSRDATTTFSTVGIVSADVSDSGMSTKSEVLRTPSREEHRTPEVKLSGSKVAEVPTTPCVEKAVESEEEVFPSARTDIADSEDAEPFAPTIVEEDEPEVIEERPSSVDNADFLDGADDDDDSPIFEYHGELLNSEETPSPLPIYEVKQHPSIIESSQPLVTPTKPSAAGGNSWLTTPSSVHSANTSVGMPELLSASGGAARQHSASPAFLSSFVEDDDDFDDLLRTDEFGDAFGAHPSLDMRMSDYESNNADFSMLQYAAPTSVTNARSSASTTSSHGPQYSSLGGYSSAYSSGVGHVQPSLVPSYATPSASKSVSGAKASPAAAAPPGLSLPNTRSVPTYASPSTHQQKPSPYQQQQLNAYHQPSSQQQRQLLQQSYQRQYLQQPQNMDLNHNDPDLAWVENLTHDYVVGDDANEGYMPGGGALFVSPVRTMGKKHADNSTAGGHDNQFWLQMNARNGEKDPRNRNPFFGPNTFFDSTRNVGDMESLEPEAYTD